jgi:FAD/FMN-containing dehydrogenase
MRGLNQPVWFDPQSKTIRVQTGMRWRDLQTIIDSHQLAVKIMQSYSSFTIGGALSVNAHGRYVGLGPLINSVRAIQIVLRGGGPIPAPRSSSR